MISCDIHPSLCIWNLQGNMWPRMAHHQHTSTIIARVPASDAMPCPFGWIWLTIAFAACFDHRWTMRQPQWLFMEKWNKVDSYKDRCWISWIPQPLVSQMLSHFKSPWDYASFGCAILSSSHGLGNSQGVPSALALPVCYLQKDLSTWAKQHSKQIQTASTWQDGVPKQRGIGRKMSTFIFYHLSGKHAENIQYKFWGIAQE